MLTPCLKWYPGPTAALAVLLRELTTGVRHGIDGGAIIPSVRAASRPLEGDGHPLARAVVAVGLAGIAPIAAHTCLVPGVALGAAEGSTASIRGWF